METITLNELLSIARLNAEGFTIDKYGNAINKSFVWQKIFIMKPPWNRMKANWQSHRSQLIVQKYTLVRRTN